jgi:hypothetical protein
MIMKDTTKEYNRSKYNSKLQWEEPKEAPKENNSLRSLVLHLDKLHDMIASRDRYIKQLEEALNAQ